MYACLEHADVQCVQVSALQRLPVRPRLMFVSEQGQPPGQGLAHSQGVQMVDSLVSEFSLT